MTLIIASANGVVPKDLFLADLLEIRIDGMETAEAIEQLPKLLQKSPVPTIVTCRSTLEGGNFEGEEEERVAMYQAALQCDAPPKYLDVEYETLSRHPLILDALTSETTGIILSWHDVKGRPKDLQQQASLMQDVAGIDIVKMVWRARSIRDNIEAFELLQSRQQPMIVLCMGEYGTMSRVLAPKFGGFATYACVDGNTATAVGQVSVSELCSMYGFKSIDKDTKFYGVIGNNVAHSASPLFHNNAFQTAGNNSVYLPLQVPEGWEHLKASFESLRAYAPLHFSGASVTIPHKENMTRLSTSADEECKQIGATNTITMKEKTAHASNTDEIAIAKLATGCGRVLLLGTGGVARAAIVAFQKQLGTSVSIAGRTPKKVKTLASEFACNIAVNGDSAFDLIINCTPVGMLGGDDPEGNPLEELAPWITLNASMHVFDTVYCPERTPLIASASNLGCNTTTGVEMFKLQAKEQQQIWSQ